MHAIIARKCQICVVATAMLVASNAGVQSLAESPSPGGSAQLVSSVHGISEYRLSNGMNVLLYRDPSAAKVTVNVTYRVGSRYESYGETGMAHLLEHLMFKGTAEHRRITKEESEHGGTFNAETEADTTQYFETMPASAANIRWAVSMEADRMTNSFIARSDLDTEMTVVRNEFERGESDPNVVLYERVYETAYLWHNYGHPTIGARSDIENVSIQRLQQFYKTYYQPDNATLIMAGNFETEAVLADVEVTFAKIPRPARVLPTIYTEEPPQDGERLVTLQRAGSSKSTVVAYHVPATANPDSAALSMLAEILSQGQTSRMYRRLVTSKLASGEAASIAPSHDPGLLLFSAGAPASDDLSALQAALIKVSESAREEPVSQEALDRTRDRDMNQFTRLFDSPEEVAKALSQGIGVGDWRFMFWERDQEKQVTVSDLQRVAAKYLLASNRTVGLFLPQADPVRAVIPGTIDLHAATRKYDGEPGPEQIDRFDATPKNIANHTISVNAGPLRMAILRKQTKGDVITVNIHLHFGDETTLRGKATVGDFALALVGQESKKYSVTQVEEELTRTKTQLSIGGTAAGLTLNLATPKENLTEVLELVAELIEKPVFPVDRFEMMKKNALSGIAGISKNPSLLARQELQHRISSGSPLDLNYYPTPEEAAQRIGALTIGDVEAFYKRFAGADHGEVAVIGSVEPEATGKLIERVFGPWKSSVPYRRVPERYTATDKEDKRFEVPDQENAVFFAGLSVPLGEDDPEYSALLLGNYLFGGRPSDSMLYRRIRQKEGLSYSVRSSLDIEELDSKGTFTVSAICAPQNERKVAIAFREELDRARSQPFAAEDVEAAKTQIVQIRRSALTTDAALSGFLVRQLYLQRDADWNERLDEKLLAVTAEQIQVAMKRYLDPEHMVQVAAGDFSKGKTAQGRSGSSR